MSLDGWEELFAKAAAPVATAVVPAAATTPTTTAKGSSSNSSSNSSAQRAQQEQPQQPQQQQRKRSRAAVEDGTSTSSHEGHDGRLVAEPLLGVTSSALWQLSGHLRSDEAFCEWKDKRGATHGTPAYMHKPCGQCGHYASSHRLIVKADAIRRDDGPQSAIVAERLANIRNTRNVVAMWIVRGKHNHDTEDDPTMDAIPDAAVCNQLRASSHSTRPSDDQAIMDLCHGLAKMGLHHPTSFERLIQLVIECDKEYYRQYYLQLTSNGQGSNTRQTKSQRRRRRRHQRKNKKHTDHNDQREKMDVLPHPTTYFGSPFFAKAVPVHKVEQEEDRYSLWTEQSGLRGFDDPLSALHKIKSRETKRFLSAWSQRESSRQEMLVALQRPVPLPASTNEKKNSKKKDAYETLLACHETPAPRLLSEWNDACRDMLCHLYGYASIPPGTPKRIRRWLSDLGLLSSGMGGIYEVGAGTGYLAAVLREAGIRVHATDAAPPTTDNNEYHGNVPAFIDDLERYSAGSTGTYDHEQQKQQQQQHLDNKALLLCYPPPGTSMAKDALQAHLSNRGTCLIHIGEFKGLTGSESFEHLLTDRMVCLDRIPCLSWGTDASTVSLWTTKTTNLSSASSSSSVFKGSPSTLLLPCSQCRTKEATRRCRVIRSLVYCSQDCFRKDHGTIGRHLDAGCIPLRVSDLDFHNKQHFYILS